MDTCLYLYCSLPPKDRDSAVCDTLASYARECAQLHVIIVWRTNTLCGKPTVEPITQTHAKPGRSLTPYLTVRSFFSLYSQVASVPEVRCSQTVCPPVPPAVRLPSHPGQLQPWASAGRSVWVAASVPETFTSTRASV